VDAAYVRKHLGYVKDLQQEFIPVVANIAQLEQMEDSHAPNVWLDVSETRRDSKVHITHEFIRERQQDFDALIADILQAIK
jgi:hypothetical protein